MKSSLSRNNLALIRISATIFIIMVAIYIPLKIYINRSEEANPLKGEVSFDIMITRNLAGALDGADPGRTIDIIQRLNDRSSLLIVDLTDITPSIAESEELAASLPIESLKSIGYDAVAPLIVGEISESMLSNPAQAFQLPLPMTSANIIPEGGTGNKMKQWVISGIAANTEDAGGTREIKAGIFSVSVVDSVRSRYSRFNAYNVISPEIAALEAANRLAREGCHIVIAISGPGAEEELDNIPGISLILEKGKEDKIRRNEEVVTVSLRMEDYMPAVLRVFLSEDSVRVSPVTVR